MEYIQSLSAQTNMFLYSFGFGFLLGILYDIVRTFRMMISRSKVIVFIADLLYFAVCAVLTFAFVLVMDSGRIRLYVAAGEVLGWLVYYFSLGSVAIKISACLCRLAKRFFSMIFKPFKVLTGKIGKQFKKSGKFAKKTLRKSNKKAKFLLQKQHNIVYNLYRYFYNYLLNNKRIKNDSKKN